MLSGGGVLGAAVGTAPTQQACAERALLRALVGVAFAEGGEHRRRAKTTTGGNTNPDGGGDHQKSPMPENRL